MRKYEGMFVFHPSADGQALENQITNVEAEITKLSGKIGGVTRMGRSSFARPMRKKDSGVYVLIRFEIDPLSVDALRKRYRLNEDLIRVQIFCATEPAVVSAPAESEPADAAAPV